MSAHEDINANVHLHVLMHGLWGTTNHLESAARVFSARHGNSSQKLGGGSASDSQDSGLLDASEHVQLLPVTVNQGTKTYDGIDWGAERAAKEILEAVHQIEKESKQIRVTKFSITGYSLGGLYARYVIAILHATGFFVNIQPLNFVTIATPHLGMPRVHTLFGRISRSLGRFMLGNTGRQLFALDDWGGTGRPWLEVAADKGSVFWKALNAFKRIDIYANAVNDLMVPYVTGAFEDNEQFTKMIAQIQVEFEPGYEPVLKSWSVLDQSPPKNLSFKEHIESWKPQPFLGPFIQWNFPYNVILMGILPITLSMVSLSLPFVYLSSSRASRRRVSVLQKEMHAEESFIERMKSFTASIGEQIEEVAEDVVEQTLPLSGCSSAEANTKTLTQAPGSSKSKIRVELSPSQRKMARNLNQLANLQKHLVWIHPTRNSHAAIICREELQIPGHKVGRGVLEHWTDHFAL
ncbi:hypothetical protein D9758_008201 [Tetrapyrgos nigripes]|uniref:DUF676 domain-containing protein n=1 Tax=Tetrapyrgos nigripes TaxID=182062 RepID=A0A8H5LGU2_9AGAR|nr:hypothetical protein D9758_008201 [Tetrapyrgos nigripes]